MIVQLIFICILNSLCWVFSSYKISLFDWFLILRKVNFIRPCILENLVLSLKVFIVRIYDIIWFQNIILNWKPIKTCFCHLIFMNLIFWIFIFMLNFIFYENLNFICIFLLNHFHIISILFVLSSHRKIFINFVLWLLYLLNNFFPI